MLKQLLMIFTLLLVCKITFSQESNLKFWKQVDSKLTDHVSIIPKPNFPDDYNTYQLDLDQLKR
jgi:hypothetical protein